MSNVINKGLNLMNTAYNSAGGIVLSGDAVKGGYFVTDTLDNIPSWTHVVGTLCYCTEDSKFYQYSGSEWKKVLFVTLGDDGKIPQSLLPDYFDDVLDFTNYSAFPLDGEVGKIYIDKDTNVTYLWNGEKYVKIGSTLELGETENTAYAGSKGKKNAEDIVNINSEIEKLSSRPIITDIENNIGNIAVSNSGYIGNIYFNTKKSVDDVKEILNSLEFVNSDETVGVYFIVCDTTKSKAILITKSLDSDTVYNIISLQEENETILFNSNTGWNSELEDNSCKITVPFNADSVNLLDTVVFIGTHNKELIDLVYTDMSNDSSIYRSFKRYR